MQWALDRPLWAVIVQMNHISSGVLLGMFQLFSALSVKALVFPFDSSAGGQKSVGEEFWRKWGWGDRVAGRSVGMSKL